MSNYMFSNLCGCVYSQGNLIYTPDGDSLISPVGNRVTVFNLRSSTSVTLPFELDKDIRTIALSPDGVLLVAVDVDGRCLLCNLPQRTVLARFNFKEKVRDLKFSPDGDFLAVAAGRKLQVWHSPSRRREFTPFSLHRTYAGHHDDIRGVAWSEDSRYIGTASKDMTARIVSLHPEEGFNPITLAAHREEVLAIYFAHTAEGYRIYTVSRDASLFTWLWEDLSGDSDEEGEQAAIEEPSKRRKKGEVHSEATAKMKRIRAVTPKNRVLSFAAQAGRWTLADRHYFEQNHARVVSTAMCRSGGKAAEGGVPTKGLLLAVGFTNGVFALHQLVPKVEEIHSLSISQHTITAAALNPTGDWLAFGSSKLGQLLVWEWRSETYVLKQQGHYYDVCSLAYSSDGSSIATGGDDGKVKVWRTTSGFCTVTFNEHTAPVKAVAFTKGGNVVVSASIDGTVRACDLVRYRNFRTFTTPDPVSFASLAVDAAGEVVAAGAADSFDIYVWAMQTGNLLDILSGHEGPVSSLAFSPGTAVSARTLLLSGSWDSSVRIWDIFAGRKGAVETLENQYDVLGLAFRPDGKQACACAIDGTLKFWDLELATLTHTIEGRYDVRGGRGAKDVRTAKNNAATHHFTTVAYSADGLSVIAGGNSRWCCLYDVDSRVLLQRFEICRNTSVDGVRDMLNSRNIGEAGPRDLIDDPDDDSDLENSYDRNRASNGGFDKLGTARGAKEDPKDKRTTAHKIKVHDVRFCPSGHGWGTATTEGLMLFRADRGEMLFDPSDLSLQLTRGAVLKLLQPPASRDDEEEPNYSLALMGALRLGETDLTREAYLAVPPGDIRLIASSLPPAFLPKLLQFMAYEVEHSRHLEFNLKWLVTLLNEHGSTFRALGKSAEMMPTLRALHRSVAVQHKSIGAIADDNLYALQYITCDAARATAAEAVDTDGGADESMDDGGAHPASEDSKEEWAEGGGGVWNDSGDDDSSD